MNGASYTISDLEQKRDELLKCAEDFKKNAEAIDIAIRWLKDDSSGHSPAKKVATLINNHTDTMERLEAEFGKGSIVGANGVQAKIVNIIRSEGRFLYRKEIIAIAEEKKIPFSGSITSALSHANANPASEIGLYMYRGNAGVWGLKQWLINGHIMEGKEHLKNEEYEKK